MGRVTRKPVRGGAIVAKSWPLMQEAVEAGITYGLLRFNKYRDVALDADGLSDLLAQYVLDAISERFSFPEDQS